jgi:flagellar biosynthesis protein FlhG
MDQAQTLRTLISQENAKNMAVLQQQTSAQREPGLRVISIASGKGGVGKTNLVTNLGIALAKQGRRVLIFDGDISLANIDIMLGISAQFHIGHVISGQKKLREIIVKGPGDIHILPGSSGLEELSALSATEKRLLLSEFEELQDEYDTLLIDTPAGINSNTLFFASAGQEIIIVVNQEPTSIKDAYALIKVLSKRYGIKRCSLVVNCVPDEDTALDIYEMLTYVLDRFLPVAVDYLGYIPRDESVHKSVMDQCPFILNYPTCGASLNVSKLAKTVLERKPIRPDHGGIKFFLGRLLEENTAMGLEH